MTPKYCAVIPTYNNPRTLRGVVELALASVEQVIVVDDASAEPGRKQADELAQDERVVLVRRAENGGKGAAVKDGLRRAQKLGFTHALQIDADHQHDLTRIPALLQASQNSPTALVLAHPEFDNTVPKSRLHARQITIFWTNLETWGRKIVDPMCGLRIYPLDATIKALPKSQHMDFDPEVAVRLVWLGVPVLNLPVKVRYLTAEEGGVSHFDMLWDNLRISWMHTRLFLLSLVLMPTRMLLGTKTRA